MKVVCASCGVASTPSDIDAAPNCTACAQPLRVLEPTVVHCGWCSSSNQRHLVDHCDNCGGPLMALPGNDPGPKPPVLPRVLPKGYWMRAMVWGNVLVGIGLIFTIVFCWTLLFPMIGIPLGYFGWRKARRWLDALEKGVPTVGEITEVKLDRSQTSNKQHPWRIDFKFERHDGGTSDGYVEAWDDVNAQRKPGDRLWIVYVEDRPEAHAIWPPVY